MRGLIGRKIGMTQLFTEAGLRIPVTVIDVSGNVVVQKKSSKGADGYTAVKLGFEEAARQEKGGLLRFRGVTRPELGVFEKVGIETPRRHVREFRVTETELDTFEVGEVVAPEAVFNAGDLIDATGTSKGHGFTGVIVRHNFAQPKMTHGTHEFFRHGGSIGMSAWPARVFKGTKMAGQHGNKQVTVQNLTVAEVVPEDGLVLVRGSVPGPNGSVLCLTRAIKKYRA